MEFGDNTIVCDKKKHRGKPAKTMKVVLTILMSLIFLFSTGCEERNKNQYSGPLEKVTVATGMFELELSGLLWLAKSRGYFRQYGLDVTINKIPAGSMALQVLQRGEIDFAAAGEFPFVKQSSELPDLRICASIARYDLLVLLGRKDQGIRKISDLKGKKVALTMKTQLEFVLAKFLLFHGMSIQDVELADVHIKDIPEALIKGDVDAGVVIFRQLPEIKKELDLNPLIWPLQKEDENYYILASRRNLIEKRPETFEPFLRAIHLAETFYNKNPNLAVDTISKAANIRRDMLEISLPSMHYELALPMALLIAMEDEYRWLIENHMIARKEVPNFLDFFHFDSLASVHPDSIGIIH